MESGVPVSERTTTTPENANGTANMISSGCTSDSNCAAMTM